jgi:hypothetical protein
VEIDVVTKKVIVKSIVSADFENKDTLELVLWKNTSIREIKSDEILLDYSFDTLSKSPVMFIPGGSPLNIIRPKGDKKNHIIKLNYTCDMSNLSGWAKYFTKEWIELNLYSAWYPVCWGSRNFTTSVNITIDDGYLVSGAGIINKGKDQWIINQTWKSNDIVIIASKRLKSKSKENNGSYIEVVYTDSFPEADAVKSLAESENVLKLYNKLFGPNNNNYFRFIISPNGRGGYARRNFFTMATTKYNDYTTMGIAHEMAHLWWSNASTTLWEDWLNEAFAEYSALMYLRNQYGVEKFNERLNKYKENSKDLPPVWEIDRNSNDAYGVLYEKGAIILYELEKKMGKEKFFKFLQLTNKQKVSKTEDLLRLIEKEFSTELKKWLTAKLKA